MVSHRRSRGPYRREEPRPSAEEVRARVRAFFAKRGPPARQLGHGYEPRPQQAAMAERALDALPHGGMALIEAGTGTRETIACLVPVRLRHPRVRERQDRLREAARDYPA